MSDYFDKDPQNPRDGGDGEGGKWPEVIGGGSSNIGGDHDSKDGSSWFGGEGGYINGDDQYDAAGQDRIGSTEYGGRTSEDISGGEGLDHEWYVEGDFYIVDPTWVSAHTSTFSNGHTNSFSGDWGT